MPTIQPTTPPQSVRQNRTMRKYYQTHASIYDATRWTFLFGRKHTIHQLSAAQPHAQHILEVGCGTGHNLVSLSKAFPKAQLTGIDVSKDMLSKAHKKTRTFSDRVNLIEQTYGLGDIAHASKVDIILFSYALTMINPQWASLIAQAQHDLVHGGVIGVTDFYDSRYPWFKDHMAHNHVRMDGHINPVLDQHFGTLHSQVKSAYGGVWKYFTYVGIKS